jgi:site-specific recombinase XerD
MASVTLRTKSIDKKGYSLFLDVYNEGHRYKEYLKLYVSKDYLKPENKNILRQDKESWELAKAIQAKRLIQIKESIAGFIPKSTKQDFIKYYREQAAIRGQETYKYVLTYLIEYNNSEKLSFKALDEKYLKDFITYLKTQELGVSSIRMYLSRLSAVLNQAVKDKLISTNPFHHLKRGQGGDIPAETQSKIEYLTIQELRKLNDTAFNDSVRHFFIFTCFTGLRLSDLMRIKWTDIQKGTLTYTQTKQGNVKTHYLPLSRQALRLLPAIGKKQIEVLKEKNELVFAHVPPKRKMNSELKVWAKKAKIDKNIHIHVGRHTFATLALTSGVSLYTVSKLLGHSKIGTTEIYAEVINSVKKQVAGMMPSL